MKWKRKELSGCFTHFPFCFHCERAALFEKEGARQPREQRLLIVQESFVTFLIGLQSYGLAVSM